METQRVHANTGKRRDRPEPLEPAEVIERRLGLPKGFLRQRRASPGGPPFYRLSRKTISYRASEVRAWLAGCASSGPITSSTSPRTARGS